MWLRKRAELVEEIRRPGRGGSSASPWISPSKSGKPKCPRPRTTGCAKRSRRYRRLWCCGDSSNRLVLCNSKYQRLHNLPDEAIRAGAAYSDLAASGAAPLVDRGNDRQSQRADARRLSRQDLRGALGRRALAAGQRAPNARRRLRLGRDGHHRPQGARTAIGQYRNNCCSPPSPSCASHADRSRRRPNNWRIWPSAITSRKRKRKWPIAPRPSFSPISSHELRTPLNAIIGFSQLMEGETFGPLGSEKYRDYRSHILFERAISAQRVFRCADMSRLESGRIHLNHVQFKVENAVGKAVLDVAETAREKRVSVEIEVNGATRSTPIRPRSRGSW